MFTRRVARTTVALGVFLLLTRCQSAPSSLAAPNASFAAAQENATVQASGQLLYGVEDYFGAKRAQGFYALVDSNTKSVITVTSSDNIGAAVPSGSHVELTGTKQNGMLKLASTTAGVNIKSAAQSKAAVTGRIHVLIVMMTFADNNDTSVAPSQLSDAAFNAQNSVNALYKEQSFGQVSEVYGDVVGYYTTNLSSSTCDWQGWGSDMESQLAANGINTANYDHTIYAFRGSNACAWAGISWVGGGQYWAKIWVSLVDQDLPLLARIIGHEMGHNLGFEHAHLDNCTDSSGAAVPISSTCSVDDTGDNFDLMGYDDSGLKHFNGAEKAYLGWVSSDQVTTVQGNGTYTLSPLEQGGAQTYVVRAQRSDGQYYYVEYRVPSALDNLPSANAGVQVHLAADVPSIGNGTILINDNPGTSAWAAPVNVGESFVDPANNIKVTTLSADGAKATVQIITTGDLNSATAPTTSASPTTPSDNPQAYNNVQIISVNSGMCVDVSGQNTAPGTQIIQYPCWGGANQHFNLSPNSDGTYTIKTVLSGACLGISGDSTDDGARLIEWPCDGTGSQRFTLSPVGGGSYELIEQQTGKCLDVTNISTAELAPLQQWSCWGGANQQFKLQP